MVEYIVTTSADTGGIKSISNTKSTSSTKSNATFIAVILFFLIIIILLVVFVFIPVRRLELKIDSIIQKVEPEIPKAERALQKLNCLINAAEGIGTFAGCKNV